MTTKNPWQLTLRQVDALDAYCEQGSPEFAARRLRVSPQAIAVLMRKARAKMAIEGGKGATVKTVLKFDRWRQGEGKGVPA